MKKTLIIFCIIIITVGITACSSSTTSYDDYSGSYNNYDNYGDSDSYDYNSDNDDYSYDNYDTNDNLELVGGVENTKGIVEYGWLTISGKVKNNSSMNYSYVEITFSVYDTENNKIGTCMDNISGLSAGETWSFKAIGEGVNNCTYYLDNIEGF